MYGIILFLIVYFIYLIVKYSGTEKPEYNLQYFRDKEHIKYPAIIVGYLDNKTIKVEHFIATALDFVCKRYVEVRETEDGTDYIFTIIKDIKASNIEINALKIFFNSEYLEVGSKQSLNQFKKIMKNEKIFGKYGNIKKAFNSLIREYFDTKQEVKKITKNTNKKNILLCYVLFLITFFILIVNTEGLTNTINSILPLLFFITIAFGLFMIVVTVIKSSLFGIFSWIPSIIITSFFLNISSFICMIIGWLPVFILILMAIIILFDDMIQRKKTNLANACEMIKGLKKYIIDYSNIDEYNIYNIYLWDEYYVYAVALNIKQI